MPRRWPVAVALLLAPAAAPAADPVSAVRAGDRLEFRVGAAAVAGYQVAGTVPDERGGGTRPLAKPFLWPLLAPNGAAVTRGWPMEPARPGETADHPHQKSAWFCHGDVIPEGIELKVKSPNKGDRGIDFWSEAREKGTDAPRYGRIACTAVGEPKADGPAHVSVETRNDWLSPDGVKVLDEVRTIHLRSLPAGRLFTFDIDLHASVCPIEFGDTKEGSFGVRVNDVIREANKGGDGKLTNAAGEAGEKAVWGRHSDWCDYSGTIDGKKAGIAVFDDPKNASRAAWHARGYGLMAANPFGRGRAGFPDRKGQADLVRVAKGDRLKLRYGIYVHDGDAAAGKVAEAYEAFKK